jgi:hypothetical protein
MLVKLDEDNREILSNSPDTSFDDRHGCCIDDPVTESNGISDRISGVNVQNQPRQIGARWPVPTIPLTRMKMMKRSLII